MQNVFQTSDACTFILHRFLSYGVLQLYLKSSQHTVQSRLLLIFQKRAVSSNIKVVAVLLLLHEQIGSVKCIFPNDVYEMGVTVSRE